MAKADDTSSTIVWIWLRDALELAAAALGSVALAKELLTEWLAAGKLPWSCMSWKGLDAEGIARLEQQNQRQGSIVLIHPSAAYHEGDPQFWRAGLTDRLGGQRARENAVAAQKPGDQGVAYAPPRAAARRAREHEEARPAGKNEKRHGPQMRRVLPALKKLYPPDGKVPDDVSTEAVRARSTKS